MVPAFLCSTASTLHDPLRYHSTLDAHPRPSTYVHKGPVLLTVQKSHHRLDFALSWRPPLRSLTHLAQTFAALLPASWTNERGSG